MSENVIEKKGADLSLDKSVNGVLESNDNREFISNEEFEKLSNIISLAKKTMDGLPDFPFEEKKMTDEQAYTLKYKMWYLWISINHNLAMKKDTYYKGMPLLGANIPI